MGHAHPTQPTSAALRDALRGEHKRAQSRALWERDKHATDHTWPETLRLKWPKAEATPGSRGTTPPDRQPTLPPRRGVIRP